MPAKIVQLENGDWVLLKHKIGDTLVTVNDTSYPTLAAAEAAWKVYIKGHRFYKQAGKYYKGEGRSRRFDPPTPQYYNP